ncbi:hypothetical protein BC332_31678 [Capsicum chinense]|nr:hypothetical protein BC332_31678 [Capsicum chinense]
MKKFEKNIGQSFPIKLLTNSHPKMKVLAARRSLLGKKVRPFLEELSNANLHVVEIFNDNISSSRTLIAIKENLLESFLELATSYDQARSTLIDKSTEIEKSESNLKVKEHLKLVMKERNEKSEALSTACQSLEEARKKVKKLKIL